ncbi:hypothetical protein NQ317_011263 [Molorchus minor]|uniref:Dipeptidase n=1 Tax=Molorchus minor TaxID=1323400 RepID=A0ABQ9JS35_9CUCU|nr:hypothetical protein NQ317_011263 [Molorchus minor]
MLPTKTTGSRGQSTIFESRSRDKSGYLLEIAILGRLRTVRLPAQGRSPADSEQIDVIRRFTEQYHPRLTLCTSSEENFNFAAVKVEIFVIRDTTNEFWIDIKAAYKRHQLCSLIGVEGGHSLAGSLAVLRTLYHIGRVLDFPMKLRATAPATGVVCLDLVLRLEEVNKVVWYKGVV